jgi:uncharacterized protein (TIRG00374 family)
MLPFRRGHLWAAIRFGIVIAIIAWIIREAGWSEIVATFRRAAPTWLLLGVAALVGETLAKGWNWARLLDSLGCSTRGRRIGLLRVYLVASLMGSVLPSTVSTDALRVVLAQRTFGGRPSSHAASIVVQNVLSWVAGCFLGLICIGVLVSRDQAPAYTVVAALLFAGVVAAGVTLHVALKYYRKWWLLTLRMVFRRRWLWLRRAARRFADALLVFERAHVRFAPRALVALLGAAFSAIVFAAVAVSVGVQVPLVVWGAIVPLSALFGLLPISVSGLGGAQAVHVFLLAPFGVAVPQAFALSALYALLNVAFTVICGALAWLVGSDPVAARAAAAAGPDGNV